MPPSYRSAVGEGRNHTSAENITQNHPQDPTGTGPGRQKETQDRPNRSGHKSKQEIKKQPHISETKRIQRMLPSIAEDESSNPSPAVKQQREATDNNQHDQHIPSQKSVPQKTTPREQVQASSSTRPPVQGPSTKGKEPVREIPSVTQSQELTPDPQIPKPVTQPASHSSKGKQAIREAPPEPTSEPRDPLPENPRAAEQDLLSSPKGKQPTRDTPRKPTLQIPTSPPPPTDPDPDPDPELLNIPPEPTFSLHRRAETWSPGDSTIRSPFYPGAEIPQWQPQQHDWGDGITASTYKPMFRPDLVSGDLSLSNTSTESSEKSDGVGRGSAVQGDDGFGTTREEEKEVNEDKATGDVMAGPSTEGRVESG